MYTIGYAAPEILRGERATATTDLYSLAVTCIVLLTGESSAALFDVDLDRWCWQAMGTWQDNSLISVLNKMLQHKPKKRFPSAPAVLAALEASPIQLLPDTAGIVDRTLRSPLPLFITRTAFNGFEMGLLAIASLSLAGTARLGSGLWIVLVAVLIGLQLSKKLGRNGLLSAIGAMPFIPFIAEALWPNVLIFSVAAMLFVVLLALVFRLVYCLVA